MKIMFKWFWRGWKVYNESKVPTKLYNEQIHSEKLQGVLGSSELNLAAVTPFLKLVKMWEGCLGVPLPTLDERWKMIEKKGGDYHVQVHVYCIFNDLSQIAEHSPYYFWQIILIQTSI